MSLGQFPYPGLRAFKREESYLFFGREGCVDDMIERLAEARFLAVLGASGSGKSSLVRTGLLDSLELGFFVKAGSRWKVIDFHPGGQPLRNLAHGLSCTEPGKTAVLDVEVLRAMMARGPRSVIEWCRNGGLQEGQNLLLLVDQFEELFRYGDYAAREEAEAFVSLLLESISDPDFPIYVVLTMRSEYLGACSLIPGLAEQINGGFYLTPRMSRDQCRQAIEGPAAVAEFTVEPALVNQLLNDMASFAPWEEERGVKQAQLLSRRADQLPLMQHLLNRLWLNAKERSVDGHVVLILDDYMKVGGLAGALDAHAAEVMATLSDLRLRDIEMVFRSLISGPDPTNAVRRPCQLSELVASAEGNEGAARRIVEVFRAPDCNFLQPPADVPLEAETLVDISHESLIRQWTTLADWLRNEALADANWRRLLDCEDRYRAHKGDLLSGIDLESLAAWWDLEQVSNAWASRHGFGFTKVSAFLKESRARSDSEARAAGARALRERSFLSTGVIVLTGLLALVGWKSLQAYRETKVAKAALVRAQDATKQAVAATFRADQQRDRATVAETKATAEEKGLQNALSQARRMEYIAKNATDDSTRQAETSAEAAVEIGSTLYSPEFKDNLGDARLRTRLSEKVNKSLEDVANGKISPDIRLQNNYLRAEASEEIGRGDEATRLFGETLDSSLTELKSQNLTEKQRFALARTGLNAGYWAAWVLHDTNEDESVANLLEKLRQIASIYYPPLNSGTVNPELKVPLARYLRLVARLDNDKGEKVKSIRVLEEEKAILSGNQFPTDDERDVAKYLRIVRDEITRLKNQDAGSAASLATVQNGTGLGDNAPSSVPKSALPQAGSSTNPKPAEESCEEEVAARDRYPTSVLAITGALSCWEDSAQRQKEPQKADDLMSQSGDLLRAALLIDSKNTDILLAKVRFLNKKSYIEVNRGKKDDAAKDKVEASRAFADAIDNKINTQQSTTALRTLFDGFIGADFDALHSGNTTKDHEMFYLKVGDAVKTVRAHYSHDPTYAFIDADTSMEVAYLLQKDGKAAESDRQFEHAETVFRTQSMLMGKRDFTEDTATACRAWTGRIEGLAAAHEVDRALVVYEEMNRLCRPLLERYPWDFYLRSPLNIATWKLGLELAEKKRFAEARPMLEFGSANGAKDASAKLAEMYLKAEGVPANDESAKKYSKLATKQSTKAYTFNVDCGGIQSPFTVYVLERAKEVAFQGVDDQVKWVYEARGCKVPVEVVDAFRKLYKIAIDNDVSLPDVVEYAFETSKEDDKKKQASAAEAQKPLTKDAEKLQESNAFYKKEQWSEAAKAAEEGLLLNPNSVDLLDRAELTYHERLFNYERAYELNARRVKLGEGKDDFVEKHLTTSRYPACVSSAKSEHSATKDQSIKALMSAFEFACLAGEGQAKESLIVGHRLRVELGSFNKKSWIFDGTEHYLKTHKAYGAEITGWISLFEALHDNDTKRAASALDALGVP